MAKRKLKTSASQLLNAINFISVAQSNKEDPIPYKNHCILKNGNAAAYDGILTAGCKIEETLEICPQTFKLIAALERCDKDVSITELQGRLSVKSGAFSAFVPCWSESMPSLSPDPPCGQISEALRTGFQMIAHLAVENGKTIVQESLLLRPGSMVATDRALILEYWHGIDLPTVVLPKSFVSAILSIPKTLTKFGYSGNSITFYFEDESWIKTQLYEEEWPDINLILNIESKPEPISESFYTALHSISSFSDGKKTEQKVYFGEGCLQSHRDKEQGASYEVEGLKFGPAFGVEKLKRIEKCIQTVDFYSHSTMFFFGLNGLVRGALAGVR